MSLMLALAVLMQGQEAFDAAVASFTGCLRAQVQAGMMARMDPAAFRAGLARSCMEEESRFRAEAIRFAVAGGWTRERAESEVATNVANARRIFADDQETYIRTGRVPR